MLGMQIPLLLCGLLLWRRFSKNSTAAAVVWSKFSPAPRNQNGKTSKQMCSYLRDTTLVGLHYFTSCFQKKSQTRYVLRLIFSGNVVFCTRWAKRP
jgi:hypothetical protein